VFYDETSGGLYLGNGDGADLIAVLQDANGAALTNISGDASDLIQTEPVNLGAQGLTLF
jgi:hypothetical protein